MNEWTLIEQLKQGDQTAFKKIVEAWQDLVYNTAIGIVQNAEDAEDVAQEVFVQVYESIHQFKGESKLRPGYTGSPSASPWIISGRKKQGRKGSLLLKTCSPIRMKRCFISRFHHPGVTLDNREKSATLFKAVSQLADNQRIAFTLHKIEGLSYQEISEIMDTTVSSVESLMHRAKTNLKKTLEKFYQEDL